MYDFDDFDDFDKYEDDSYLDKELRPVLRKIIIRRLFPENKIETKSYNT